MNEQQTKTDQLIHLINPLIVQLGYEVVYLEIINNRQRTLRIFIDFNETGLSHHSDSLPISLEEVPAGSPLEAIPLKTIGIEDCVKVTRALDEPLDQLPEVEALFKGPYELEVSSPGVDRPLRTPRDYERFLGKEARIHVYRPLSAEELNNANYQSRNPKQKNFFGILKGFRENRVLLEVSNTSPAEKSALKHSGKKTQKKGKAGNGLEKNTLVPLTNSAEEVAIPLPLISKANLEPRFIEFGDERE